MPKPKAGVGQVSDLRVDMQRNPEDTIARIVGAYESEQDLNRVAERFGAGRRTLERLIAEYPTLKNKISQVRIRLGIV